ncbi:hypothetical protein N0V95_001413 [Ascochyta clinopodiicola]|nr:hypothetical protein N0V95_001413 [Ascochyta clinopodiicola]
MGTNPLSPDTQAARQVRIDSDIIKLCCRPEPPYTIPTVHGIGLFTHVAGPKLVQQNPQGIYADRNDGEVALLPLGGPHKIVPSKLREPPNEEVAAIYQELRDAVQAEEKIWNDMRAAAEAKGEPVNDAYKISLDTLKKKYGDIDTPTPESTKLQQDHPHQDKRRYSEAAGTVPNEVLKRRKVSFAQHSEARRQSTDVSMGGIGMRVERQENAGKGGNMYEAHRDPRRQGR